LKAFKLRCIQNAASSFLSLTAVSYAKTFLAKSKDANILNMPEKTSLRKLRYFVENFEKTALLMSQTTKNQTTAETEFNKCFF